MIAGRQPLLRRDRKARAPLARVVVHPELLRAIGTASAGAGHDETGGPLLGTVQRSWEGTAPTPIVAVLGTVPPGPDLDSAPASVGLGADCDGDRAVAAMHWWRAVTGLELMHLGDWHKHPSGYPEPSPGDRATARAMSFECSGPVWLVAVAVTERSLHGRTEVEAHVLRRTSDRSQTDEVRFHRADARVGLVRTPVTVDGGALPQLPPLPWHIAQPSRFAAECRLLKAAGFAVASRPAPNDGRPAVELRLERAGWAPVTVFTGGRFPLEPPTLRDEAGRPVRVPGGWSPGRFLVDVVEEAWRW